MKVRTGTHLLLAVVLALSGCGFLDARQTLRHLDDGRTVFAEGRRDICLRVEDPEGEVVDEDCDIVEDPLGMDQYSLFDLEGGTLLVGVAPVDVVEVVATVDGRERKADLVDTDLATGFYLLELPADASDVTIEGRTAEAELVDDPVEVELGG